MLKVYGNNPVDFEHIMEYFEVRECVDDAIRDVSVEIETLRKQIRILSYVVFVLLVALIFK